MKDGIKRIYLGLPNKFREIVFWVGRKYRTNLLSHKPGGSDIIVEYHSGKILGYDWIKYPSRYIQRIFRKLFFKDDTTFENYKEFEQVQIIKKEISRVFTRVYEKDDFENVPFEEIWNSKTSTSLPWINIEEYIERIEQEKKRTQELPPGEIYERELNYIESTPDNKFIESIAEKAQNERVRIQPFDPYDDEDDILPF